MAVLVGWMCSPSRASSPSKLWRTFWRWLRSWLQRYVSSRKDPPTRGGGGPPWGPWRRSPRIGLVSPAIPVGCRLFGVSLSLSLSLSTGKRGSSGPAVPPLARERAPAVHGICSYPLWDSPTEAQLYRIEVWAVGVPRWSQQNNRIGSYWSPNAEHLQTKRKHSKARTKT